MRIANQSAVMVSVLLLNLTITGCGSSDTASSSTNSSDNLLPPSTNNRQPTAIVVAPQAYPSGETVTIDGSGSSDPDGDALTYSWTQTQGAPVSHAGDSGQQFAFTAPTVVQPTTYRFQLSVSDGELSDSASIDIQISPVVDITPPSITSRSPQPNQTGFSTTAQISATFDEPLLESSVNSQSLSLTQSGSFISGSVSYDSNSHSIRFTPDAELAAVTTYTVSLRSNIQDPSGNFASAQSWSFTTGTHYNLGTTSQQTIDLCMDDSDKLMLTLVNNAREATRSCGSTSYPAVAPLAWHCLLKNAAQGHSTSMADNDYHDHTGIDGSSPGDRITAAGYDWRAYGENIAAGYTDEEAVMEGWLSSSGHCKNIMNSIFTEMGAASAENNASTYGIYWTQNFATR
ncbi:MAG: Ig-like domain-containing protein [Candidatus Thiodiazotropha sp. (ex Monitilora ramsayi)]|nr:Ig-like domain-containing protein [Candidatus Thiodiazotropha sp. (ex Monitilora ramsayi)]